MNKSSPKLVRLLAFAAASCLLLTCHVHAADVGGTLSGDTTWTVAGSPYDVTNTVIVPNNVTLIVSAGALVRLATGASINAQAGGIIEVAGTRASPVLFRSLGGTNIWGRLGASGANASLIMRHADVEHGQTAVLSGAAGRFDYCHFHDYQNPTGDTYTKPILVSDQATALTVSACHFANYYETLFRRGVIIVEDSLFEYLTGDALDFDTATPGSVVRRCTFRHGTLSNVDAVDLGSDSTGVLVENCLMYDFPFDKGVSIGEHSTNITVRGCLIYGVDAGVAVKDSSDAVVVQNTIAASNFALRLYEKVAGEGNGQATAWNNIFWNNTNAIELLHGSTIAIGHSDISGAGIYPGSNNFNADPLFLNPVLGDFRLAASSPAINAGTNNATLGALFPVGSFLVDSDGDSLPDTWEQTYALNFNDPSDAALDSDLDGLTNREEFLAGTSPTSAASHLALHAFALPGNAIQLSFDAISNRLYTIEAQAFLPAGVWTNFVSIPAASINRLIQITNSTDSTSSRFYRLGVQLE